MLYEMFHSTLTFNSSAGRVSIASSEITKKAAGLFFYRVVCVLALINSHFPQRVCVAKSVGNIRCDADTNEYRVSLNRF